MKVYLTMGRDGRILIQARIEQAGVIADLLHYIAQGEDFSGVPFDEFAKVTPGPFELPEQPDTTSVQPDTMAGAENPQQPQPEAAGP